MDLAEFQERATPVVDPPEGAMGVLYAAVGLGGESGEILNVCKKMVRDGASVDLDNALVDEAGDVLFYLRMLLEKNGYTIEDAAEACIRKLDAKKKEK